MSGGGTLSTSDTKIEALSLQSSAFGVTIPLLYGVNRVAGNLIWYGGFKATPHTTSQSTGKGGGVKSQNTTYTYSASLMMGLVEGQISGVSRVWKGKQIYSGGPTPSQIVTASEAYTVPGGGGAFTVAHSAAFSAAIGVNAASGWGEYLTYMSLSEGTDFTRVGGVYTFPAALAGMAVTVNYQYLTGGGAQTALQALGLSFAGGALGQAPWSFLATFTPDSPPGGAAGSQAVGYSGLAYVYAQDYQLGTTASVDNHTFEVQGPQAYSIDPAVPDANPAAVAQDVLINGRYGAAFPSDRLAPFDRWSTYCLASGVLMSPLLDTQMSGADFVTLMGRLTNTAPVWSGGRLKMIPYGDTNMTGNGVTFTADVTPVYDLTDDDFKGGSDPVRVNRKPQADAYNHVRVEFLNRSNLYNFEIAEAKDSANIDAYGLRSADVLQAHWICDAAVARAVAQLLLQRTLYVRNGYTFGLPWTKALLEPMDLVTITDPLVGDKLPVRITKIEEDVDGTLAVECEDFPLGVAHASIYPNQTPGGFQHDYGAAPGSVTAPTIFEGPGALSVNGLELYVAATGAGAHWGGCNVYVSLDGTNYKQMGTIFGGSRFGTLTADAPGGIMSVALHDCAANHPVMNTASNADALALNSLLWVGGASPEFISFDTATLAYSLHYDLNMVTRAAYGTTTVLHHSGESFVRIDSAVARSGPIDLGYVGKTIHIKLTSFNIYGAAEESLASVSDYTYTITGSQIYGNAGAAALAGISGAASDNLLTVAEKPPIILDVQNIVNEYSGLISAAIVAGVSYTAYDTAYNNLIVTYLPSLTAGSYAWDDLAIGPPVHNTIIVGTAFRAWFEAYYAQRQLLTLAIEAADRLIASTAAANAAAALSAAVAANAELANIANDNILSVNEKPTVILDYNNIINEQSGIDAQASAAGFATACAALKTTYDGTITTLTSYLGGLGPWPWNDLTAGHDTNIVGSTFRAFFASVYTARQNLLNQIAASAATLSTWTGITGTGKPIQYRVVSYGYLSSPPDPIGLYNLDTSTNLSGANYWTMVARFNRSTGAWIDSTQFNLYSGGATAANAMAAFLNGSCTSSHIVVVWTVDQPGSYYWRSYGSLLAAMYRCGATPGIWGFPYDDFGAKGYILIGIPEVQRGTGFEMLSSGVSTACETSFTIQNGIFNASGTPTQPMILTAQIAIHGATAFYEDDYSFGGAAYGTGWSTARSFAVVPDSDATVEFTAKITADQIYPDAGHNCIWTVNDNGAGDVTVGNAVPSSTAKQDMSCVASFTAYAGHTYTVKIQVHDNYGEPVIHLWDSVIRLTFIKR